MTLDEAIKHAEEVAYQKDLESGFETDNERYAMTDKERTDCKECAKDFRQLSDWLKELKRLKEQEPCEDCISRQAVIDSIRNYFHDEYYQRTSIQDCRDCLIEDVIKPLPSVMPQPKTGHWIDKFGGVYRCSCCREIISIDTEIEHPNGITYKYCPNCGCRMSEGSE